MGTYVRIRIGSETYALGVEHVMEVAELGSLTPVPGSLDSVLGIYNLRGEILPVYDLSAILGIKRSGSQSRLLVAETHGQRVGLAVDEVTDVVELADASEKTGSRFLSGASIIGDVLVGFVDVVALFEALQVRAAA